MADSALTLSIAGLVIMVGYMTWKTWNTALRDENWRQFVNAHPELGGGWE